MLPFRPPKCIANIRQRIGYRAGDPNAPNPSRFPCHYPLPPVGHTHDWFWGLPTANFRYHPRRHLGMTQLRCRVIPTNSSGYDPTQRAGITQKHKVVIGQCVTMRPRPLFTYFSPTQRKPPLTRPLILLSFSTVLSVGSHRDTGFQYRPPVWLRNRITTSNEFCIIVPIY